MSLNLNQNLSQQQVLSPQMRQGLELLQASSLELNQIIQQTLTTNPVLEQSFTDSPLEIDTQESAEQDTETLENLADDYRESAITETRSTSNTLDQDTIDFIYNSIVAPKTLQKHLFNQLNIAGKPANIHHAAETLIGYLDDRGFLTETLEEIGAKENISFTTLTSAKATIQAFDPSGVGAADIKESLLIQLAQQGIYQGVIIQIIEDHLNALVYKRFTEISRALKTTNQLISEAAELIGTLNMNPGAEFDPTMNPQIQPDVIITFNNEGELQAHLTNSYLPHLTISGSYKELLASTADSEVRKYLKENIRSGRALIQSLSQRQETILKIVEVLMNKQKDFFRLGPQALKPLTMNEVAELIEVHPTTVSRACTTKYILTPIGMYEMRYFFSTALENSDGVYISNTSIRDNIKQIIDSEDPKKPLPDIVIEKKLKELGINVARRTISKYREQLGIFPSNLRKKY